MSPTKIPGELSVSFRYTPGVGNTAFFEALRDRGVFLGSRCEDCGVTYLPARIFCERCLAELEPSLECGPEGELVSWTVVRVDVDDQPLDARSRTGSCGWTAPTPCCSIGCWTPAASPRSAIGCAPCWCPTATARSSTWKGSLRAGG